MHKRENEPALLIQSPVLSIILSRAALNVKYFKASRSDVTLHHNVFIHKMHPRSHTLQETFSLF